MTERTPGLQCQDRGGTRHYTAGLPSVPVLPLLLLLLSSTAVVLAGPTLHTPPLLL